MFEQLKQIVWALLWAQIELIIKKNQIKYDQAKYDIVAWHGLGSISIILTTDHIISRTWDVEL